MTNTTLEELEANARAAEEKANKNGRVVIDTPESIVVGKLEKQLETARKAMYATDEWRKYEASAEAVRKAWREYNAQYYIENDRFPSGKS